MGDKHWQELRESGFRILFVGLFSLIIAFIIYSRLTAPSSDPLAMETQQLMRLAYAMFAITAAAMAAVIYGAFTILHSEQMRTARTSSLISFITGTFEKGRNSWKILAVAALGYGIFFGCLSQILVYRPDVSFTEKGIKVPSIDIIPCCAPPGYMPMLTLYISDHFLVLIIPINVILATMVL